MHTFCRAAASADTRESLEAARMHGIPCGSRHEHAARSRQTKGKRLGDAKRGHVWDHNVWVECVCGGEGGDHVQSPQFGSLVNVVGGGGPG